MNQSAYFDLEDIWINELVGDIWLFLFVGLIIIWFVSIKAKIPHEISIILSVFWIGVVFVSAFDAILIVWILTVAGVGFLFYYNLTKALKRG